MRKKHDALYEEAAVIEKMKDPVQQNKAWRRYMKRPLAVAREGLEYSRALTDNAMQRAREPKKQTAAILARMETTPRLRQSHRKVN